jgi:hypothetical protein
MTNVVNHAYPPGSLGTRIAHLRNRWWMVGHFNRLRKELRILFFDQGVGIPVTLPKRFGREKLNEILGTLGVVDPNDGELIQAAMEIGRTKTELRHRGKGLNDFKKLLDACGGGRLAILSNHGVYEYTYPADQHHWSLKDSIGGTLIEWSVPLAAIANWQPGEADGNTGEIQHRP